MENDGNLDSTARTHLSSSEQEGLVIQAIVGLYSY